MKFIIVSTARGIVLSNGLNSLLVQLFFTTRFIYKFKVQWQFRFRATTGKVLAGSCQRDEVNNCVHSKGHCTRQWFKPLMGTFLQLGFISEFYSQWQQEFRDTSYAKCWLVAVKGMKFIIVSTVRGIIQDNGLKPLCIQVFGSNKNPILFKHLFTHFN